MNVRFAFTEDRRLARDNLRGALDRDCTPAVVRAAWDGGASPIWKTLVDLGIVALTVPEAHGGLGLDALDWVLLLEECGRAAVPAPIAETMAIAVPALCEIANDELSERWLPAIANEGAIVAVGFDRTKLVHDADVARLLLLRHEGEVHAIAREDVSLERRASVDRSRRLFEVAWTPTRATRVAEGSAAHRVAANAFDRGALAASAELVGLGRRMVDMTVDYAKVRRQFGAQIGSFQAVKHHLASALVKIELSRPAVHRAAWSIANRDPDRACHVSVAKASASDAALFAARVALQCHGAIGYSFEHDLHLWMKRAWALAASCGDAAWHRARVATSIAPEPAGERS